MAKKKSTVSTTKTSGKPSKANQRKVSPKPMVAEKSKANASNENTSKKKLVKEVATVAPVSTVASKSPKQSLAKPSKPSVSKPKATKALSAKGMVKSKKNTVTSSSKTKATSNFTKTDSDQLVANEMQNFPTEAQMRKVKTGLTKKDLASFRALLSQKRAELIGDVKTLRRDAKNLSVNVSYDNMADTSSDSYAKESMFGLMESGKQLLEEIEDALDRLDKGIYGVCVESGKPIGIHRLEAKPWAKYCIEVAREKERQSSHSSNDN